MLKALPPSVRRRTLRDSKRREKTVAYAELVQRVRSGIAGKGTSPRPRLRAKDVPLMFW